MRTPIISWKGSPRRLPRIRIASDPSSSPRGNAQVAAEQVLKRPLGATLEKERRKYQFKVFLRGRHRASRGSSATFRTRKRANQRISQRAKQNLQMFGWQSEEASNLDPTGKSTSEEPKPEPEPNQITTRTERKANPRQQYPTSVLNSLDGATNPVPGRYSLMHFADVPVYWGQLPNKNVQYIPKKLAKGRRPDRRQHVGALTVVSTRRTSRVSQNIGGGRAHTPRFDHELVYNSQQMKDHICKPLPNPRRSRQGTDRAVQTSLSWKTLQSLKNCSPIQVTASPSVASAVQSIVSKASRTPSQKRAIHRFAKGLESHLQAYQAQPNDSLPRSPPSTTISAYTIEEFTPYQADFQAAGLAVTSTEQKRGIERLPKAPAPPPTPMKGVTFQGQDPFVVGISDVEELSNRNSICLNASSMGMRGGKKPDKGKEPSYASGSTGTTVLGFTPPHEKSYPRSSPHRRMSSASDHTIVGFTPPHERERAWQTKAPPLAPKTTPRRILPWLRKKEPAPAITPSPAKTSIVPDQQPYPPPSSTPLRVWVSDAPKGEASHKPEEAARKPKYVHEGEPFSKSTKTRQHNEPLSKLSPSIAMAGREGSREEITPQMYEIELSTAQKLARRSKAVDDDYRDVVNRRRTLPSSSRTYRQISYLGCETCDDPSSSNLYKPLESTTKNLDQSTQTQFTERSRLFPFAPVPTRGLTHAEASPIILKTDTYIEEEEAKIALAKRKAPENKIPTLLPKRASSTKLCAQCAYKIETNNLEGNQIPNPDPKPQGIFCQICGTKSCFTCQQCSPSRQNTFELNPNPEQPGETDYKPPADILPTETVTYTTPTRPAPVEPTLKDTIRKLSTEERLKHGPAIQEMILKYARQNPVADPPKKLYISRSQSPTKADSSFPVSQAKPPPETPTSILRQPFSSSTLDSVNNMQVFKGLQVATAAACDRDVDRWLEEVTGTSARKFLADLNAFEGLGINALADVAKRAAKQRRDKLMAWETIREKRLEGRVGFDGEGV